MSIGRRSMLAAVMGSALPLPPPKAPRPPTLIGPDAWWNPFSPAWPTTAAGRAAWEAARRKTAQVADDVEQAAEALQASVPDPIVAAEIVVGRPSWGYYFPTVAAGLGSAALLAVAGGLVYRAKHKRKR